MKLSDIFPLNENTEEKVNDASYQPEDDALTRREVSDSRKPSLTLRMINRLKLIRGHKKAERAEHLKLISNLYKKKDDSEDLI